MNLNEVEIIEVSVHYGETKSLPEYSNVKPGYSLKAVVKPGQDPEAVKEALAQQVKQWVWEDCDAALEREGRRAEFYQGLRYDLRILAEDWLAVITPENAELPKVWSGIHCPKSGWRLEALRKYAAENYEKLTLIDLSGGDLGTLPDLQRYEAIWLNYGGKTYCLVLPYGFDTNTLPDIWQDYRFTDYRHYTRLISSFLAWITDQAKSKEATLIDCLDGDLSKLPDLAPKDASPEVEPDMDEPNEEADDDDDDDDEPSF